MILVKFLFFFLGKLKAKVGAPSLDKATGVLLDAHLCQVPARESDKSASEAALLNVINKQAKPS